MMKIAISMISLEEGYRERPYLCSAGYPTIAIGKRIGDYGTPLKAFQFTVSKAVADAWLKEDLLVLHDKLMDYDWYSTINEPRCAVLLSTAYQVGFNGLMAFKKTIAHLKKYDFARASGELLDSKVAKIQAPLRWNRQAEVMRTGKLIDYYL